MTNAQVGTVKSAVNEPVASVGDLGWLTLTAVVALLVLAWRRRAR